MTQTTDKCTPTTTNTTAPADSQTGYMGLSSEDKINFLAAVAIYATVSPDFMDAVLALMEAEEAAGRTMPAADVKKAYFSPEIKKIIL